MSAQEHRGNSFDTLAKAYYALTPAIPEAYVGLLQETFHITSGDSVIDLGCGSGDLALALASNAASMQGVDSSETMIALARKKDMGRQVVWNRGAVEEFDFGVEKHQLVLAFESFHLFTDQPRIIQQIARGLKTGGYLGVGWANYEWEQSLHNAITEAFLPYGLSWKDWGYWACPTFPAMIESAHSSFSTPQQREVTMETSIPIKNIVSYLFSIGKTSTLDRKTRSIISTILLERFTQVYPSRMAAGETQYSVMYCIKLPAVSNLLR